MARIDGFVAKLFSESARELELQSGGGVLLRGRGGEQPLLKQPLTAAQIAGALAEIVPSELQAGFPQPGATAFPYPSPHGMVDVRVESSAAGLRLISTSAP